MNKKPTDEEFEKRIQELEKTESECKGALEELRESEEKYKLIAETSQTGIYIHQDDIIMYANEKFAELHGYAVDELIGTKYSNLFHPDERDRVLKIKLKRLRGDEDTSQYYEARRVKKDGGIIWCQTFAIRIEYQGKQAILGNIVDITERKQAGEALRQSEKRLSKINKCFLKFGTEPLENINLLTMLCGELMGATCALYNRLEEGMLYSWGQWNTPSGYNPVDKPDGHICYDVIKSDSDEIFVVSNLQNTNYAQTDPNVIPYKLQTYMGRIVKLRNTNIGSLCVVFQDDFVPGEADKRIMEIIASALSVEEERKRAEEMLRKSEEKYRLHFENVSDVIFSIDPDFKVINVSPSVERVLGYKPDELIGKPFQDLNVLAQDYLEQAFSDIMRVLAGERIDLLEYEFISKDGTRKFGEVSSAPLVRGGKIISVVAIARDITDRKRAEKALRESEEKLFRSKKMEFMGFLAGSVAHDLNNVLSGIINYPELILMDLPEDSKLRKPIETIQMSGHRAIAIVRDLLTVARGAATTKQPMNLNDLIRDYLNSPEFKKLMRFHPLVTVKPNLDTDLFNISGSYIHTRKVVMNLVSNASEAIEDSGNVNISTMNRYLDRPLRGYDDINIGEYVVLAVSDDGLGISSDDLERIFEPFYTKKVMGRSGTGLGLAVVWNVIQDHKGYIDVKSYENGTTFELYFPTTRDEIPDKALSIPIKDYKGNGETILVVDDLEIQRDISCKMLDTLGYKTKAVSSGEEAVEYLKENTADLILLDMIMDPGINGRETYERVIKIHPKQKAIIISGFVKSDDVKVAQKLGAGQYIKKPVTLEKIGMAIKEELEK